METEYMSTAGTRPRQPDSYDRSGKRHQPQQNHLAPHHPPPVIAALPESVYTGPPVQAQTAPPQKPRFPPGSCFGCGQTDHWLDRCPQRGRAESQSVTRPHQHQRPAQQQTNQQTPQAHYIYHQQTIPNFRPQHTYQSEGASGSQQLPVPAQGAHQQQTQGQQGRMYAMDANQTHQGAEQSTWERGGIIREQYPEAFLHPGMI